MFDFVLTGKICIEFYYKLIHNRKGYEQESAFQLVKPFDGILDMARYSSERTYFKHMASGSVNE
jgi:hypothetical protein